MEKGWSFQQMMLEQWDIHIPKKSTFIHTSHPIPKLMQNVIDLKVKLKVIKLLEENTGENL